MTRNSGIWVRRIAIVVGLFVVLAGLADLTARAARAVLGEEAGFFIFGPPVSAQEERVSAPAATAAGAIVPVRLRVPALGIDASVEQVGKRADGTMGIPQDFNNVSWYMSGGKPGGAGNAVFAGHVNNARTRAGVFAHLSQAAPGDYVTVADAEGKTLVYIVSEVQVIPADEAPAEEIFKTTGPSQLILITCEGEWVPQGRTFDKRLIVIARSAY